MSGWPGQRSDDTAGQAGAGTPEETWVVEEEAVGIVHRTLIFQGEVGGIMSCVWKYKGFQYLIY